MKTFNVLFLCTGNSARSIMAEAMCSTESKGRMIGFSAGTKPYGSVNPYAVGEITRLGYPVDELRSKSWSEFATPDAPRMDFIITVCDEAAGEPCPVWPGKPVSAHWSFPNPVHIQGDDEARRWVFKQIAIGLSRRIQLMSSLPLEVLDRTALQYEIEHVAGD
jgi:arsenate reductase